MKVRTITLAAVLALGAPVSAQQSVDPLRNQIMTFEDVLRRAIELAGENLSRQVQEQLRPAFPIQMGFDPAAPVVRGWPIEGYGYHFDVQVPDVAETGRLVLRLLPRPGVPAPRPSETTEARPVASGGVVTDDPMGRSTGPAAAPAAPTFNPDSVYRDNVRLALIDAIINNPGVLNLRAGDMVAVSAAGVWQSPLYRMSPRFMRLTLYFSGADLIALREGKLSREDIRKRIREQTF